MCDSHIIKIRHQEHGAAITEPPSSIQSLSHLQQLFEARIKDTEGFFGSVGGNGVGQQRVEVLEGEGGEKEDREGVLPGGNEDHPVALTNSFREVLPTEHSK